MNLEQEILQIKNMLERMTSAIVEDNSASSESYIDYLLRWYQNYKLPNNRKNTSKDMYSAIINNIAPAIGMYPLNQLTGDIIQSYLMSIERPNMRQKIYMIINGSLKKAVKLRLLKYNPVDVVEIRSHRSRHYDPLTFEYQVLLAEKITNKLYYAIYNVLVCSGLRVGELLALDHSDVDFNDKYIIVRKSMNVRTGEVNNYTKTESGVRRVPFLQSLKPHLMRFLNEKRKNGVTYNQIKCYFRKLYKRLNITGLNIHSFRHTFGSMAYDAGVKEKHIQKIMGHATLDVTMNIYVDVYGGGESPFLEYFQELKKDIEKRPCNFFQKTFLK